MTRELLHVLRRAGSFALACIITGAAPAVAQQATGASTVILVRHAEKAALPADDPPLAPAGEARARALLDAVRDAGVTAIVTTQLARTRATAQPTASALGIAPHVVPAGGASHVQNVVAAIRMHPGQTVLVVGHSNTVPAIIAALGAPQPPAICDSQYDNLYIVTVRPDGTSGVTRASYGSRSPSDSSCASTMR
jgi:broad specificity phosphatase PhoE